MSLFGALGTAVSGLNGQSANFANISDNIANSQTVGFKRVDTAFRDILATSNERTNDSESVVARPVYRNDVQGPITQTDNALAFAINGDGFFSISRPTSTVNGATTFSNQTFYTRSGDFQLNKEGYLVNSAGDYLNGWTVDSSTGLPNRNAIKPIQVSQTFAAPVSSSNLNLAANLPSYDVAGTAPAASPITSTATVYDSQGAQHELKLVFTADTTTPNGAAPAGVGVANQWNLLIKDDNDNFIGNATVLFAADGTLQTVTQHGLVFDGSGNVATMTDASGDTVPQLGTDTTIAATTDVPNPTATLQLKTEYASTAGTLNKYSKDPPTTPPTYFQSVNLNFGTIGGSGGLTQYAGTAYSLRGINQDGVPPGAFNSLSNTSAGDIVANFDNGQSRVVARVPVITFPAPDSLQRRDGSAYTATLDAGDPLARDAGTSGAGTLTTSATESSNVDIGQEFTHLIVAQRAYSANAKLVTTADDMLQTTIDMKR